MRDHRRKIESKSKHLQLRSGQGEQWIVGGGEIISKKIVKGKIVFCFVGKDFNHFRC